MKTKSLPYLDIFKKREWFNAPKIWLMMPYSQKPGQAFQVGEFRDAFSANLALDRLTQEIKILCRKTPKSGKSLATGKTPKKKSRSN